MDSASVKLLQARLAELGLYHATVDGKRGPKTHAAAHAALEARSADLPSGWRDWSAKRQCVAFLQLCCRDAGPIDGWWGPQTEFAVGALAETRRTGQPPEPWRDEAPRAANPNGWPVDTGDQSAMTAFYGPHGVKDGMTPPMRTVTCPWRLRLSWNLASGTQRIGCHAKVADSLERVLGAVFRHYGMTEIRRLRLDIYGGCYSPRRKRGGSTWSTHAWAIALDFDPDNNRLEWGRDRAAFARPDYDAWWKIWEGEGWLSLGRSRNFDWMHVQAARLG